MVTSSRIPIRRRFLSQMRRALTAEDRINSAVQKTVGDRPFVVTRKVPFRFWNEDGTSEDRCAVTFRLKRSPPDEVGSILISLKDYRVISTKSDATIAGIWDASGICP